MTMSKITTCLACLALASLPHMAGAQDVATVGVEAPTELTADVSEQAHEEAPTVENLQAAPAASTPTQAHDDVQLRYSPWPDVLSRPAGQRGVPFAISIGEQVYGQYSLFFPSGADWTHAFELPRAWIYGMFRVDDVIGRVLIEGTRATGDGALGVAQDSLLVRVREAWVGYRLFEMLEARVGLIPTLNAPLLTRLVGMRALSRIGLREFDLIAPADLGASLTFDLPEGFGRLGAAYWNGEGYTSRELNRGKNLELMAEVHPLAFMREARPLALVLGYTNGSLGAGATRSDRVLGALTWSEPMLSVGISGAYVLGIQDRGDREGAMVEAWARGRLFDHLLLGAQFFHFARDLSGTDVLSQLTMHVGAHVHDALRVYVAVDGRFAGEAARVAVPSWERWELRLVVESNFALEFTGGL